MKEVVSKFNVNGTSKDWVVQKYDDGSYSCNCPSWIFHKGQKVDCKHIIELKNCNVDYYNKTETTISIDGIKKANATEIIITALKHEIESNEDWLNDCCESKEEEEAYRQIIKEQKEVIMELKNNDK